jgi:hypothetical protein
VNERIENSENKHIKLTGAEDKRRWSLVYPSEEEPINSPFYGQLPGIGIADLLWFVAEKTGFLGAFRHVLERYVKQDADARLILACVVAMGTNMGLWKMAEVSGLSYSSLLTTARNFLRVETLHAANDGIANATTALSMFEQYDIDAHKPKNGRRTIFRRRNRPSPSDLMADTFGGVMHRAETRAGLRSLPANPWSKRGGRTALPSFSAPTNTRVPASAHCSSRRVWSTTNRSHSSPMAATQSGHGLRNSIRGPST